MKSFHSFSSPTPHSQQKKVTGHTQIALSPDRYSRGILERIRGRRGGECQLSDNSIEVLSQSNGRSLYTEETLVREGIGFI